MVFTAGGTESDNLAIRGAAEALEPPGRKHLITTRDRARGRAQHDEGARARAAGASRSLPVDASGIVSPDRLREAITDDTALVSVMHANNEIGTIQPIAELAAHRARARRAVSHRRRADAPARCRSTCTRSASTCCRSPAHKFYGPKGTGALWIEARRAPRAAR